MENDWFFYQLTINPRDSAPTQQYFADSISHNCRVLITYYHSSLPWIMVETKPFRPIVSRSTASAYELGHEIYKEHFIERLQADFPAFMALMQLSTPMEGVQIPLQSAAAPQGFRQKCIVCGSEFDSKRPATTCSAKCRVKAHRIAAKGVTDGVTMEE